MKRLIDLVLVISTAVLWVPAVAVLWLVVAVRLGRPSFFTQVRPGLFGRPFRLIKFRTMTNRRDLNGQLLPDAQRLTRFGRWLRATSLDELPELWNVLKGEMSLVGPRPLLMEYLPLYNDEQRRRHDVLPGITGWAQINGRNAVEWTERFALDLWYVEHRGVLLDLRILIMTVARVFQRKGISAEGSATMPRFEGNPR